MARDYFDESKKKKTTTQKAATKTKSQSSSVAKPKATTSKATKAASKSTFLGGGASTQKVQQANKKPSTVKKPATTKKTVTQQERINQKMYGSTTAPERRTKTPASNAQRKTNAEANLNLKQTAAQTSRTRLAETETQRRAAQTQKMTAGVDATKARAQTREIGNEIRRSVTDSLSADNRAFAQRQKSGTLTEEDKKKVEQRDQRRAQIAKNTGAVAWKAAQDTVSGYGQSLADVDEMVKSNKNWTKAKAQKMGIDLNDKAKVSKVEQERQQSIKEAREFRQELFNKQEKRQAEWDERTKNAKGLEKAWYGAVESGTGMLADTAVGAVTGTGQFGALASMGLRTYGSSANQARKEGATDKEARLYGLAQSAKEVGTELMFQGAGLAKAAYGKTGLSLADKSANVLTRGLTGIKADAVGAGVRALGGTAEENIEELAGWAADPLIKELTYGKAVRNRMKENLRANIPQIGSDADAANVASYFSTPKFTDDLTKEYVKSGMSKDKASALAAEMRDYYVAYYSGDQGKVDALEEDLATKLSGQDKLSFKSWSMDELKDTLASTTLLTLATGIPGAVNTSVKGNQIFNSDEVKKVFGNDAVRKVADAVKNTSNKEMSLKAEVMKQRLDSGKDLTGTQKFDLYQGYIEKVNETSKKARASYGVVENAREEQDLVPTMGVDRAGNTVYAKETQKEYNEKFASTELTVEAIKNYMESDNSISDDESRRANAVKKAVADIHVGGLTVGDAHEFAYGNDLAREALKAEEGIDLDRYVVRRADGTVDLAATNEATENALFQINADNAIKAAQAETEVYIDDTRGNIDKDLLTRFGNSGQAAWKEVNKDLDPRDLKNYLTTANAASYFYSAGRNTDMSVDTAINRYADTFKTVDNSVLEKAFTAGAEDRIIANTPGYGQTVEAGSNIQLKKTEPIITGQLIMDDDVVIPDSDQSAYLALAMSTNSNIHIVGNLNAMGKDGKPIINQATGLPVQLNGMSHGNEIYLNMNASAEQNLGYVFMHEMTHQIKQYAPNEYLALENLVRDKWFNKDATGMQAAIKQRMDLYSVKGGQQLTEEKAVEEIIADAMAEAMDDPNFAAEVCEQDINLGEKILESIRGALRSIRQIFANSDVKNDRFHNSLLSYLGILDEAEKMWIDALHTARQNKADGLIADWQDKANKQNAPRLSVGEEKYSITTDKEDFIKGANLSKDLRDWAKEMGLDKLSKQPIKGPVIVSVRDLRTAWYEKNGRTDEANVINTALDKIGDSLTQLVGKYQYIDLGDALNAAVTYRTDAEGKPTSVILSCQVKNAEYEVNFDFTTICAKRLAMQKILERFIKTEGERQGTTLYDELKLDEEGLYKLRLILETAGFDVSCRGCFVEQNRYSQQNQARTIANDWNAALDDWARENGTEVTENFGLTTLDIDNLDYEEIEAGFERYHELMKGKKTDVATKNRMLIEASPFFRKRMNASDYASMTGQRALMAIGESKKGGTNLYGLLKRGQSDSKQSVPFTAYNGEISLLPDNMKGKSLYDYLLSIGGARAQSASDFQIEFVYDYMQMVADLSARGLPMHMYTKVIELAELFGMTGIKINLSAMCDVAEDVGGEYAGLKLVDGKYEYNISDQSIDYPKAVELQKRDGYSKNIGIIMVTLSSQHMLKSLDDPDVRYIIGYHSSAMPVVVANMSNMGGATDYTKINKTNKLNEKGQALFDEAMAEAKGNTELEKYKDALRIFDEKIQEETAKKKKKPRRGNEYGAYMSAYGNNTADFNTYDNLLETKDARKTADKYLEHCMENGLIPIYFPFAFHENYYKCEVYDFNMYDNNTGEYAPMGGVQNIYPGLNMAAGETDTTAFTERVSQMMDAQNRTNKALDSQYDAVFDEAKNTLKYSITGDDYMDFDASGIDHNELTHRADAPMTAEQQRDADYMAAVESGDMETAQRMVDEAAKANGYVESVYHGTGEYFNIFKMGREGIHLGNIDQAKQVSKNRYHDRSKTTRYTYDEVLNNYEKLDHDAKLKLAAAADRAKWHHTSLVFRDSLPDFDTENFTDDELKKYVKAVSDEYEKNNVYPLGFELPTFDRKVGENLMHLYAKISNPFVIENDLLDWTPSYIAEVLLQRAEGKTNMDGRFEMYGGGFDMDISGSEFNPDDMGRMDLQRLSGGLVKGDQAWRLLEEVLYWNGGYDGIKYLNKYEGDKNSYSYIALKPSDVKSADPVTYDDNGNVIPLSERFNQESPDIRFSLSEPIERVADLIAVHNLKPDDIRNTFELGGFPMPSIAITKDSMGHDLYGDITLMFHSDTVDPEFFRSNQVFGGDAWTPTFPTIAKKVSRKVADKVDKKLKGILGLGQYDYTLGDLRLPSLDDDNLTNALRYNEPYEAFKNDEVFQIAYLKNAKNFDVAVPTKEGRIRSFDKQALEYLDDNLPELTYNDIYDTVDHTMKYEPAVRKARKDYYENKGGVKLKALAKHLDEEMGYSDVISRLEALIKFREEGIPEVTDRDALKKILDDNVDQEGYKAWIDNLFEGIIEKTGIRNDTDMFTPSGNRRSWESLHDPVTLENVVKVMKSELAAGSGIFGGNPKGAAQKQYKSLDEIRADEDRLQSLPEEEYEALSKEAVGKMSEVCVSIAEHNPKRFTNSFGAALDVGSDIAEILNSTRKRSTIQSKLKKDYLLDVTDEQMDDLMDAIDAIANLPTGYFEAKPRRAVGFDEVKAAIIPQNTDEDIKAGLSERGIATYEYDPDIEDDRTQKINDAASENDLRFSISANLDEPYMDAVNSNNMDEAQKLVDEAAKMAGYTERVYHGTGANFTVFDINKSGNNHGGYSMFGKGFYFSDSEAVANAWGKDRKLMHTFIRLENPYIASDDITEGPLFDAFTELRNKWGFPKKDTLDGILAFETLNEQYGYDYTTELLKENGYDGVIYTHPESKTKAKKEDSKAGTKEYIVFDAENIKSADPVTYDIGYKENGNRTKSVIPLSERFDPTNNDIRYSLPTQDSDGKILTDGQMEYFKNSQARDAQGRLVPVYHTTKEGGFTIFDPQRADNHRSLFFTNSRRMSASYSKRDGRTPSLINPYDVTAPNTTINNVQDLPNFGEVDVSIPDVISRISNIKVVDRNGNKVASGDSFVDVAISVGKYLEDKGWDLSDDLGVDPYLIDEEHNWGSKEGDAFDLYTALWEADLKYTMDFADPVSTYMTYLNLENPLVIDAHGEAWDSVPYGGNSTRIRNPYLYFEPEWDQTEEGDPLLNGYNLSVSWEQLSEEGNWEDKSIDRTFLNFDNPENLSWYPEAEITAAMNANGLNYDLFNEMVKGGEEEPMDGSIKFESNDAEKVIDIYDTTYNTRQLAEIAQSNGYDGVIIKDVVDYGDWGYGLSPADVYIAFSSNQVKDVNNENPTENPDIRYSITPEDEAMSHMAHDYAYDTSYEALAYYEDLIAADASTETTYEKAKNYIAKDVDEFYAGLTRYADGMKFDDPVLEEGRTRMAKSKQDYFNSNVAKWNDAWLTDGEVLDPKSIKKPVRDLVMAVMSESNTNKKYKTDLVNKAIIDIRLAYFYAKKGRTDVADALLWHSAHRMIDGVEFYADDTSYEEYKGLRDYMKNTRIQLGEEYWSDVDFGAFRKENFGRMNLVKGETNVDKIYAELEDMYPGLFDSEEYDNAPDQLMHMASVLDSVQPYAEAYLSEYCAEWATDIASDLLDIMQNGKELQSIADRYTNKYEAKIKAMKARHAEAMLKVRQQRDEGINAQKAKFKEYKEQQKEKRAHDKSFESIQKTHKKLTERLLTNTADKNIPEQYKRDLARLLAAFDLQTVGSKKYEMRTGRQGQKTIKMAALKTALTNIENKSHEFHVSDAITDIIDELLGKDAGNGYGRSIEGLTIDELSASELDRIDKLLKALLHEFNTYRNVKIGAKRQQTEDIGKAQVDSALEHAKMFGAGKDYQNIPGGIDRIINLDEVTPAYMFKHIDPEKSGLGLMFKELRRSFDKYVKNQEQLNEWMDDIVGKYHKRSKLPWKKYGAGELENWRSENYAQTFNLENGPVTLTPAQMMSLYCLSKRTQAYNHMTGAGIVVAPVSFNAKIMSDLKKKPNTALPVKLTDADIKQIVAQLTPDQIKVADDLQQLMAERMAAWGNEASMNVLGIELFGEPDYFPIKSDKAALEKDLNENEFVEAIRNFGFTKAVQPGARNAIMVDDIFNVVTEHCNNMNLYNAYSEALNDFMKVYNYRDFRDDGSEYTVQQAIAHAYGSKATTFIMTFMRDLNGNVSGRASGIENLYNSLLGNAKKAAVFANLRVAAQQPTAITRAFAVIDPKYLKGIKIENGAMDELFEHCPIALWKSWGYYDINMGKSIEDIMMNNGRWLEDAATEIYGALDNVTWTAIWQMVKAEMKDTHPDVKVGSDEYWELCNERMTEVVDLTQVVDSPFHRSHAMRDKGIFIKAATSFMAEPTLTFNMLRDGVIRSREAWKKGDKAEAAKIAARIGAVALLQAATVAGAASLVDALRKKRPDKDDEDERFLHLWWVNALENFRDEMKVWNKIYFVKDIASIFDGWDNSNLALQGIQKFALGYRQLTEDPYARSSATWYENMADGIGYMTGVPVKTVRTGLKNAMTMLGVSVSALDSVNEKLDSVSLKNEDGETGMIGKLLGLVLSDDEDSLLDKYAEKKGYKKVEKNDEDTGSEKTSESGEAEETEKREQLDYDTMLNKALKAAEGYEGEEYNQRIYSSVAQGMKGYIADGDYVSIGMMRTVIEQAGGDVNYFDQRVMEETKSAYKKSLNYDMSYEERWDQKAMYRYMMQHGMSQEELSSEVLYKSDLAKDMKVAYRIGDNDTIYEAMLPLVDAGITETDLERLYENRNRMDLTKYKQNGRFKDKLKSMGTFIWPTDGVITSHFGYRNAPTAGASSNHPAIDIGAPQGTSVVAADGGVIIYAGTNSGYGNSVGIKHDNGMVTYYNHLYAYNVKVGDTVAQGQQIAQVGSTGISTGPHLDFKILDKNGKPVDPEKYLGK